MKGSLFSSFRRITATVVAALALAGGLLGCASGPKVLDVVIPGDVVGAEEVRVIEYLGSNAGEPVPSWLEPPPGELEAMPAFSDSYVFRFALDGAALGHEHSAVDVDQVSTHFRSPHLDLAVDGFDVTTDDCSAAQFDRAIDQLYTTIDAGIAA